MSRQPAPASRSVAILHSIVAEYIESGEPVASRTIVARLRESLSSASVRNVMAELDELGYLSQPHTSAGRVPTKKAFRSYIESLNARRVVSAELARIRGDLEMLETIEARVERSCYLLTELSRGFGIAAAFPTDSQILDQVDLLALSDRRVLMVVATRDRMVHNRVIAMNEEISQLELQEIRNYLNHHFSGWLLSDVRRHLEQILSHERAAYDSILRRLQLLCDQGLLDFGLSPELHVEGVYNLLGLDLHLTREKMRELFRTLEQKKKILHLLDRFLEEPEGEVAVQLGLDEEHPAMSELALIGIRVELPGGGAGKLAVLGPMRMDYGRVISAVRHVGQALRGTHA